MAQRQDSCKALVLMVTSASSFWCGVKRNLPYTWPLDLRVTCGFQQAEAALKHKHHLPVSVADPSAFPQAEGAPSISII